jgi:hypothetical protein
MQFGVEIEATSCCDFGVDGHHPSIHDPQLEI